MLSLTAVQALKLLAVLENIGHDGEAGGGRGRPRICVSTPVQLVLGASKLTCEYL